MRRAESTRQEARDLASCCQVCLGLTTWPMVGTPLYLPKTQFFMYLGQFLHLIRSQRTFYVKDQLFEASLVI